MLLKDYFLVKIALSFLLKQYKILKEVSHNDATGQKYNFRNIQLP